MEAGWVKKNYSKTAVVSKVKLQSFATDKKQRKAREKQSKPILQEGKFG